MPLTREGEPEGGLALVARAVGDLMPPPPLRAFVLSIVGRSATAASEPVPIHTLATEALNQPQPLSQARQIGWRYLVNNARGTAVVDLAGTGSDDLKFNQMVHGSAAAGLTEAVTRAEELFGARGDYQMRILSMPPLHLEAFWLAGADGNHFLLRDAAGETRAMEEGELIDLARRLADRKSSPRDGGDWGG